MTQDILEKAGFKEWVDGCEGYIKDGFIIISQYYLPNGDGKYWAKWEHTETPITKNHFEYVHQLQNLYYSLTGEELQIKL